MALYAFVSRETDGKDELKPHFCQQQGARRAWAPGGECLAPEVHKVPKELRRLRYHLVSSIDFTALNALPGGACLLQLVYRERE
jgi:hypothetical protein